MAEAKLGLVALCLIGPRQPVTLREGGNSLHWPVGLRAVSDPTRATQRTSSEHWEGNKDNPPVWLLTYLWTDSDRAAQKLKIELHTLLLGEDPELRRLNGAWVDLMEWRQAWKPLTKQAQAILRSRGETVNIFDDAGRIKLINIEKNRELHGRSRPFSPVS